MPRVRPHGLSAHHSSACPRALPCVHSSPNAMSTWRKSFEAFVVCFSRRESERGSLRCVCQCRGRQAHAARQRRYYAHSAQCARVPLPPRPSRASQRR